MFSFQFFDIFQIFYNNQVLFLQVDKKVNIIENHLMDVAKIFQAEVWKMLAILYSFGKNHLCVQSFQGDTFERNPCQLTFITEKILKFIFHKWTWTYSAYYVASSKVLKRVQTSK